MSIESNPDQQSESTDSNPTTRKSNLQQLENLVDAQSQTIKKQQRELQNLQEENQLLQKRNQELYEDSFQQESREKERQSPKERSISKSRGREIE